MRYADFFYFKLMRSMKNIFFLMILTLLATTAQAQDSSIQMEETFRSNGKIYVVLTNALIVLGVLALFLIRVELRLTRMENDGNLSSKKIT